MFRTVHLERNGLIYPFVSIAEPPFLLRILSSLQLSPLAVCQSERLRGKGHRRSSWLNR